jgi:uncharacterized protein (DUF2249 family)
MKTDDHPETDTRPLLDNIQHREYQSLIGMLQWAVKLCRIDICYATSSISRFSAAPREGHLSRVLRIWGYLKKCPNRALDIDHKPIPNTDEIQHKAIIDFANQYSYAKEEIDIHFPKPLGDELKVNIYIDSDHAHDKITGRSISGVVVYVGSTPIIWRSKCQGSVQTSTYGAELKPMRLAVEEAITIRYMLRSLGIKVLEPSNTIRDNKATIVCATNPETGLKKKNVALSYHFIREQAAIKSINPCKIGSKNNVADLLTKPLERGVFMQHTGRLLSLGTNGDVRTEDLEQNS